MSNEKMNLCNASGTTDLEPHSLTTLFEEGLDLYNNLGKIDEPTNSLAVQANINKAIHIFEDSTRLVSVAGIFSSNEEIDELPTEHLRYLLLPALLGSLCLKLTSRSRLEVTGLAETYFKDFLQRCNSYGLSDYKFRNVEETDSHLSEDTHKTQYECLREAVNTRANKIQRFKEQKELQSRLETLKQVMKNENVDEEVKRTYYLNMVKSCIYEAVDELGSIETEKQMLEHMNKLNHGEEKPKKRPPSQPLKPVIITKDAMQKAVFGAGYPSLPIMSVEEFYEKRVQEGIFPDVNSKTTESRYLQDAAASVVSRITEQEKEEKRIDEDDPQLLEQMRQKDEFKDDHRRGWGNRINRS